MNELMNEMSVNEIDTPFGQLRPLQGGNLARVASYMEGRS